MNWRDQMQVLASTIFHHALKFSFTARRVVDWYELIDLVENARMIKKPLMTAVLVPEIGFQTKARSSDFERHLDFWAHDPHSESGQSL